MATEKSIPLFWPGAYNACYNFYGDDDDDDNDDDKDQSVRFHGSSTTSVSRAWTEEQKGADLIIMVSDIKQRSSKS